MKTTIGRLKRLIRESSGLKVGDVVEPSQLRKGMIVGMLTTRPSDNWWCKTEILGVTDIGESTVSFDSVSQAMASVGVESVADLETYEDSRRDLDVNDRYFGLKVKVLEHQDGPYELMLRLARGEWAYYNGSSVVNYRRFMLLDKSVNKVLDKSELSNMLRQALVDRDRDSYLVFLDALEEHDPEVRLRIEETSGSLADVLLRLQKLFPDVIKLTRDGYNSEFELPDGLVVGCNRGNVSIGYPDSRVTLYNVVGEHRRRSNEEARLFFYQEDPKRPRTIELSIERSSRKLFVAFSLATLPEEVPKGPGTPRRTTYDRYMKILVSARDRAMKDYTQLWDLLKVPKKKNDEDVATKP